MTREQEGTQLRRRKAQLEADLKAVNKALQDMERAETLEKYPCDCVAENSTLGIGTMGEQIARRRKPLPGEAYAVYSCFVVLDFDAIVTASLDCPKCYGAGIPIIQLGQSPGPKEPIDPPSV